MSARLRVVHTTGFTYAGPATSSFNEARITPRSDSRQTVILDHVDTSPSARLYRYTDYWGSLVTAFDLHAPHDSLEVTGTAVVEVDDEARSADAAAATWELLASDDVLDEHDEWLGASDYAPIRPKLSEFAREAAAGLSPVLAAEAVVAGVHGAMQYEPGTTEVHSTARDAWRQRRGVCQDYAHITLSMLRSLGIPARYVSGYLHPKASAAIGETVEGESHAWVEVWTGGWWGIDPTNNTAITDRHVTVGIGRDYADVTPIKGIYAGGGGESDLEVSVRITRLA
ncbi:MULTISPECIES: transglutaminase family protein [unclassified Gordonia (in: high G+C Gram-positive bacteria)]|uniref:transglutaminase family protein n=1 Tax=unclassified Gordonia (in: high G+C Gram-positive bacteria) TaxID=2657482 RepID=UPI001FFE7534|nr:MULTISPECIES: transglutaminase family protein [unclassified Gordonia (in: high G+C Gram-positive bacteria)]UQE75394.1 transglutaminase family protein [Gordonia sp. PP30]